MKTLWDSQNISDTRKETAILYFIEHALRGGGRGKGRGGGEEEEEEGKEEEEEETP